MTGLLTGPITEDEYLAAYASGDEELIAQAEALLDPYFSFVPRQNRPELFDEQAAALACNEKVTVILGGNRSGKTRTAAQKVARRILTVPPPRPYFPYWVIGETYDLSCGVCWVEKLSTLVPASAIIGYDWYKKQRKWPFAVMLKHPTIPGAVGWVLEFKSFEQGRERMQAASIGGAWFNEQPPLHLVDETFARTVDYNAPLIIDFTPMKPSLDWPNRYRNPPDGWKFFHLNSELNDTINPKAVAQFLASIPADYRETRRIGMFAALQGAVFKDWNASKHVVKPFALPLDTYRTRGIDFGWVAPFVCVWWARLPCTTILPDGRKALEGTWVLYREYVKAATLIKDHAKAIKEAELWDERLSGRYGVTVADNDPQDIGELRDHGVNVRAADKGPDSVKAGVYEMQKLMLQPVPDDPNIAPQLLVFDTCERFIQEVGAYRYEDGTEKRNSRDVPVKKDDHAIDASRYVIDLGVKRFSGAYSNVGGMLPPSEPKANWKTAAKAWGVGR